MAALRDGTAELHQAVENEAFQKRMARGELARAEYAAWLGQMLHIHRDLEGALAVARARDARFEPVVVEHFKETNLRADLASLGAGEPETLPATNAILARIAAAAQDEPLRLLGYHYVLEGSMNGNRFLARRLSPALELRPGDGDRYLDPYGERQREVWARFKDEMGRVPFATADREVLVEAAREMFTAIGELSRQLTATPSGRAAAGS